MFTRLAKTAPSVERLGNSFSFAAPCVERRFNIFFYFLSFCLIFCGERFFVVEKSVDHSDMLNMKKDSVDFFLVDRI